MRRCLICTATMVTHDPTAQRPRHAGRGLCQTCYDYMRSRGRLKKYPRLGRQP